MFIMQALDGKLLIGLTANEVTTLRKELDTFSPKVLGSRRRLAYLLNELAHYEMQARGIMLPKDEVSPNEV